MRRVFIVTVLFGAVLASASGQTALSFSDVDLEAAIRQAINKPTGTLYDTDVATLKYLTLQNPAIGSLEGIEQCQALLQLNLVGLPITDFSPVSLLTNLYRLSIADVSLPDLSFLPSQLRSINLRNTGTDDLHSLSGVTGLTSFRMDDDAITSLSGLESLPNLISIYVINCPLSDISAVASMPPLEGFYLYNCPVQDISVLESHDDLRDLSLEYYLNPPVLIDDFEPIRDMTNLQYCRLGGGRGFTDLSLVADKIYLQVLTLFGCDLGDISALSDLTYMRYLDVQHTGISDISVVANMPLLEGLMISGNEIEDISALRNLHRLDSLGASANKIRDISALAGKPLLNSVGLHQNFVTDLSPLMSALALTKWLALDYNPLNEQSCSVYLPALQSRVAVLTSLGCCDPNDTDSDGLSNTFEAIQGTSQHRPDTDEDGLTDYEELIIYASDPKDNDSDDDGIIDSVDPDVQPRYGDPVPLDAFESNMDLFDAEAPLLYGTQGLDYLTEDVYGYFPARPWLGLVAWVLGEASHAHHETASIAYQTHLAALRGEWHYDSPEFGGYAISDFEHVLAASMLISSEHRDYWVSKLSLNNDYAPFTVSGTTSKSITYPFSPDGDLDGDGISNADEYEAAGNNLMVLLFNTTSLDPIDSDSDGIPDHLEPAGDIDGDGLDNVDDTDSDGDGISDGLELEFGLDPWGTDDADAVPLSALWASLALVMVAWRALRFPSRTT